MCVIIKLPKWVLKTCLTDRGVLLLWLVYIFKIKPAKKDRECKAITKAAWTESGLQPGRRQPPVAEESGHSHTEIGWDKDGQTNGFTGDFSLSVATTFSSSFQSHSFLYGFKVCFVKKKTDAAVKHNPSVNERGL